MNEELRTEAMELCVTAAEKFSNNNEVSYHSSAFAEIALMHCLRLLALEFERRLHCYQCFPVDSVIHNLSVMAMSRVHSGRRDTTLLKHMDASQKIRLFTAVNAVCFV